jgi:hypothetical protein
MLSGRASSGDSISDADKYVRLTDAQLYVINDAAPRCPKSFYSHAAYGSLPTLTSSDGGKIFTFGTDLNGDPLFPIGKVRIFQSLASYPDFPWVEGYDYINEGNQIRIPNNTTYGGTLWWRGIAPPIAISASNQPTITPPNFRLLIVYEAVRRYALEGGTRNAALYDSMDAEYVKTFKQACLVWKTQFSNGGALGSISGLRLGMAASNAGGFA